MKIELRPNYFVRALDATSQWLNTILLNGNANDSISGRAFKESWDSEKFINKIVFWEPEHCKIAYYSDLARAKTMVYEEESK
jgi:hypothetical protein